MDSSQGTIGILIFDQVEVLDFSGPFEVFSVAARLGEDRDGSLFRAVTIAPSSGIVTCTGGLRVDPHYTFVDHPPLDLLVVPGGAGTRDEGISRECVEWIRSQIAQVPMIASVCTGAILLAEAGLLASGPATTHWSFLESMRERYPDIQFLEDARIVDRGSVITSAGISAGIDMALHIVERLHDRQSAEWTARRMEYDWRRESIPVQIT